MKGHIAISEILKADSNVTAIVSQRIHPLRRPSGGLLPAIVYELSDTDPHDTKSGVSLMDHDFVRVFIEGHTPYNSTFVDLISKVRTALDRYSGTIGGITVQSVQFLGNSEFDEQIDGKSIIVHEQEYKVSVNA
jgi:hypothetical protein